MCRTSLFLLTFLLTVDLSNALTVGRNEPTTKKTLQASRSNTSAHLERDGKRVALVQEHFPRGGHFPVLVHTNGVDPIMVRPNAGAGPDTVKFGLLAKNFYGANLKGMTFTIDLVLSLRWNDSRVIRLIPEGLDKMTMAWSQALEKIWMPGIVVTNRDIEKYEIISSSVMIYRTGEVLRVERSQARLMFKFALKQYPFDTQNLQVKLASSKYMSDEVVLVSSEKASGVDEHIWGLYDLQKWHLRVYEDRDGNLMKSRGYIDIQIKRQLGKYFDDHLLPSLICLAISWAVFYFPFANPFITPRLALSIIALLTFTNLMVKSIKELPGSAPFNWNDLYNQQIQSLMFITIILNIASEIIDHTYGNKDLSRRMNNQAKIFLPGLSILNIGLIISGGIFKWMSLEACTGITKATIIFAIFGYGGFVGFGVHKEYKANKDNEALLAAAAADDQEADDCDADAGGDAGGDC